jgi:prepilin-type N-terminal cleavage/methylation domain-containing protein
VSTVRHTGPPTVDDEPHAPRDGEAGFTLIELLVTMSIATIVLFAILQGSEFLQRTTAASSRVTDAQETGRGAMRDLTNEARQATTLVSGRVTPLEAASRSSIVFAATLGTGATPQARWVRWCATTDGRLLRGELATAPTVGQSTSACGAGSNGWSYRTVVAGTLVDGARLFSFTAAAGYTANSCPQQPVTSATPNPPACVPAVEAVTGIGIRLAVADRATSATRTVVTRGAVSFRNRFQQ